MGDVLEYSTEVRMIQCILLYLSLQYCSTVAGLQIQCKVDDKKQVIAAATDSCARRATTVHIITQYDGPKIEMRGTDVPDAPLQIVCTIVLYCA